MINESMINLTKKMVQIPSVNTTQGEREIGLFLEQYIRDIPYFKKHPDQVIAQNLKNDDLDRRSVFALLIGEKDDNADTIILHGHTDTVGVEDFGDLAEYAFSPDLLREKMKLARLPKEVLEDLQSNDYIFGRGACDMKSGDAVFIETLRELSEHPDKLSGNILLSLNPVEENLHTGIIEGIDTLKSLKEKYGLNYILAINNDYICPLYPGDSTYTIYTGVVGKLLPCFYIHGKETHVGQCFEGFDASMLAAMLVEKINLNTDFSDEYMGECALPPTVLKMKDLKPWYNVQTAVEAMAYFNYFVHNASMTEITEKLLDAGKSVVDEFMDRLNENFKKFCDMSGQEYTEIDYDARVYSYSELLELARGCDGFSEAEIDRIVKKETEAGVDKREIPIEVIRYLLHVTGIKQPVVVLYFAAPYCPHNTLQGENEHIIDEVKKISEGIEEKYGISYRMMKFFPSLSDSSYLKIDDDEESVDMLVKNFPGFDELYPLPLSDIRNLDIPAINYGCYGKDAHKWTERVNIPYTFEILPELIKRTIEFYLA